MIISLVIAGWLVCSILSYLIAFNFFQAEFEHFEGDLAGSDRGAAVLLSLFGPFSLVVVFCLSSFCKHGIRRW